MTTNRAGWEASRWRRMQAAAIPRIVAPAMLGIAGTWRREAIGIEQFDACVKAGRAPIIACWHQVILPGTLFWRDRGIVILASRNFDGEWITRTLVRFGFSAVRGSSSQGGARALGTLSRVLRSGAGVAITMDGPRGPARHAQPGALWLARLTGHPILPFHVAASPAWHLGSWDRGLVPPPRSRVAMVVGEPFIVSREADDAALDARRRDLERAMHDVERRAIAAVTSST